MTSSTMQSKPHTYFLLVVATSGNPKLIFMQLVELKGALDNGLTMLLMVVESSLGKKNGTAAAGRLGLPPCPIAFIDSL
ncbi:Uncharacterized protein TCM_029835 [Theobroma cacao]|uniref:Uncharacterized protein n=1 Tax=Theobroma cacao TaxID=3641 RepID=A0A061GFN0_THECC|nr:Uncharacterized protein TCM_029835 [Theobroma cacao]